MARIADTHQHINSPFTVIFQVAFGTLFKDMINAHCIITSYPKRCGLQILAVYFRVYIHIHSIDSECQASVTTGR